MAKKLLLCSGFHRSGTSLLAQTLHANGVAFGANLLGASFGNQEGHFEDQHLVAIHNRLLSESGTDWRVHSTSPLSVTENQQSALLDFTHQALEQPGLWAGAKDPRAMSFLHVWSKIPDVRLIVIYRHWKYCVSSLLKRHCGEILFSIATPSELKFQAEFWRLPTLALKMWMHSARQLISTLESSPGAVFCFSHEAFTQRNYAICQQADAAGLPSSLFELKTYRSVLEQHQVPESLQGMLPASLCEEADKLMAELTRITGEAPSSSPAYSPLPLLAKALDKKVIHNQSTLSPMLAPETQHFWMTCDMKSLPQTLAHLPLKASIEQILNVVSTRADLGEMVLFELAKIALKYRMLMLSEIFIRKSIDKREGPYKWLFLGTLYTQLRQPDAKACLLRAQQSFSTPPPELFIRQIDLALSEGNISSARGYLAKLKENGAQQRVVTHAEQRIEARQRNIDIRAVEYRFMQPPAPYGAPDQRAEKNHDFFSTQLRRAYLLRDNLPWLSELIRPFSPAAKTCFLDYVAHYWSSLWPQQALENNLALKLQGAATPHSVARKDARIAVWVHIYYLDLLPELLSFIDQIANPVMLFATCPEEMVSSVTEALPDNAVIIGCINRGRDMGPWLIHAHHFTQHFDLVLKLHTKQSPHASTLKNWRLQLLGLLLGDQVQAGACINRFMQDDKLGLLYPAYHPALKEAINWGSNQRIANDVCQKIGLKQAASPDDFPAGSMFYYRPEALKALTSHPWKWEDFDEESAQIDGTIMHAIERLIGYITSESGFNVSNVDWSA